MEDKIYNLLPLNTLVDGNEKFVKYLIELFISTTPPILEDLKASMEAGDIDGVYAHTHKIKPTLDSMGMSELRETVNEIMSIAKQKKNSNRLKLQVETLYSKVYLAISQLQQNEL